MAKVALSIEGNNKPAIQIEPGIIYRIGRRLGLEFYIDDESIELAHATIALIPGGIVRLSAVAGKVFVNGLETDMKNISSSDSTRSVALRFGNVSAKLSVNENKQFDDEEANDTSGFEEGSRNKSTNRTSDSLNIPESEPQSANTTGNVDSFIVPETQAFGFNRPSRGHEESKISLGDDFLIPETQDVLLNINNPVLTNQDQDLASEGDESELGSQIRICTQEFNEFNEDAIDDFDSSLLLGDNGLTVFPPSKQPEDNAGVNLDMSALNWTASNSKCTALNSTKANDVSSRGDICLTPDLSLADHRSEEHSNVPCTPDIFDLLDAEQNERMGSCTPELNLPASVLSDTPNKTDDNQKLCSAKQPAVAIIETPDATPAELQDNSEDCIETQAFPARNMHMEQLQISNTDDDNEDFIATQAFPKRKLHSKQNESSDDLEDFIATQAFFGPTKSKQKPNDTIGTRLSTTAQIHNHNEDLIETQAFPTRTSLPAPSAKSSKADDNLEDFIATQAFVNPQKSTGVKNTNLNMATKLHNSTEDFTETQLFIPPTDKFNNSTANEIDNDCLQVVGSLISGDELDHALSQLIALSAVPDSPVVNKKRDKSVEHIVSMDKKLDKVSQSKKLQNKSDNKHKDQEKPKRKSDRKRLAARSVSPQATPIKKTRTQQLSEPSPSSRTAAAELGIPANSPKTRRKRSLAVNAEPTEPPKKTRSKIAQSIAASTAEEKAQKDKSADKKDTSEDRKGGKLSDTRPQTREVVVTIKRASTKSKNESEKKAAADRNQEQTKYDNDGPSSSKDIKERKSTKKTKDSKVDKPDVIEKQETVNRKPKKQYKSAGTVIEANGKEKPTSHKNVAKEDEILSTTRELRRPVTAPTEEVTRITREAKAAASLKIMRKSTSKGERESFLTENEQLSRDASDESNRKVVNGLDLVAKTANSRKMSQQSSTNSIEEEPTSISKIRTNNDRKNKLPSPDPLKDINDYMKKLKSSGRKIRLALSMCNYVELNPVLKFLKNVVEVTENPLDCDLLIMDKGERTYKFLVGIARSKPILSTQWLHAVKKTRSIFVESEHLFKDEKFEKIFKFNPLLVLKSPSLLNERDFMLGGEIQPNANNMKAIIECAGGTVHSKPPPITSNIKLYVVASKRDKHVWQLLRNYTNVEYINTEGVMQALVQQKAELLDDHKLKF